MSNLGEQMGCFNMHRFNLSMHILHVFIQEFEMFLNLYCGLGRHANALSRSKARPEHLTRVGVLFSIRSIYPLTDSLRLNHFKCRVNLEHRSSLSNFLSKIV